MHSTGCSLFLLIHQPVSPIIGQHRLKLQLVGKKLAVGCGFLLALGFELRHLFRRIVVLLQDSGEHILKGFQSLFVHHVLRYFSAATPDFIQASTSLILNFHSLPIFVAGISLLSIQASTVSRLTPRYSQISFMEYQRSIFESIFSPHFQVDIKIHNKVYHKISRISMIFADLCRIKSFFSYIQRGKS